MRLCSDTHTTLSVPPTKKNCSASSQCHGELDAFQIAPWALRAAVVCNGFASHPYIVREMLKVRIAVARALRVIGSDDNRTATSCAASRRTNSFGCVFRPFCVELGPLCGEFDNS